MSATDGAIAANRFGFGARPGDLARLGSQARDAVVAQLRAAPPLIEEDLPASHELLARVIAERDALRSANQRPPAPQQQDPSGSSPAAGTVNVLRAARALREIYQPAYQADVGARSRAAILRENDFLERLVFFWSNHFAVSVDKRAVLGLAGAMEREAIRPHVLGNFADMLLAVERHPAMLLYLDNQQSIGPNSQAAQLAGRRGRALGLNENLGREILELHTLGVDGKYTQSDVQALAAMITGWSIGGDGGRLRGGEPGRFFFREAFHEPGARSLLGRRYAEDGIAQGEAGLRALAVNPHTARHLAMKLARHFVADEPPAALVDRLTRAYLDAQGDLPATYRALIESPEAWRVPLAKFKTPTEYVLSTYRALSLPFASDKDLRVFELLGQRSFQPGSPAGWPDRSADWDGSAALLKRLEWAQELGQRLGSSRDAQQLAAASLGASLSAGTHEAVARAQDGAQALTLLLASPEFMRR
ncbi:MAG TPA: DUF1800 domain-containing protein [Steroidobacteraceae bacterium]|nr:DUF1800 domain-containing protein [Steroidobacteraceae bacterium]